MKLRRLSAMIAGVLCMVLLAGAAVSFAGEAEASDVAAIKDKGVLVVGITDFAPMDYRNDDGKWIGFDADLATQFAADYLGVDVEFQEIDWDNKILELNAGTVDCIWNGMTLTDEVAEAMECTITYALNAQVVVMAADKLADYPDAESMAGLYFAAEAGSAGEAVALEAGFEVNSVQNQTAALMEVAAGTSDACVIDKTMADAMTGEGTSYDSLGYSVSLSSEEYVVGFRKGSDATQLLNDAFEAWIEDGTLAEMSEKYDNAVSIAEIKDDADSEGASSDGESADGESADGESDPSNDPNNKDESEAPPMGEDGRPLKPGE